MCSHAGKADRPIDMKSALIIRITVRGLLSERFAAAFDGMTLACRTDVTDIVGEFVDQAQLYGLLTRIRDLALELESLSVGDVDPAAPNREDRKWQAN
jgi:hypothetical protein